MNMILNNGVQQPLYMIYLRIQIIKFIRPTKLSEPLQANKHAQPNSQSFVGHRPSNATIQNPTKAITFIHPYAQHTRITIQKVVEFSHNRKNKLKVIPLESKHPIQRIIKYTKNNPPITKTQSAQKNPKSTH